MLTKEEKDRIFENLKSYKDVPKGDRTDRLAPMYNAVTRGDVDNVQELIEQDVKLTEYEQGTILTAAIKSKELLLKHDNTNNDHDEIIKILLKSGVNPNKVIDQNNKSALYHAVELGYDEIAVTLLESGADPNIKTKEGQSILHIASLNGMSEVTEKLLDHGADINSKDHRGKTPIDYAQNNPEVLAILQEHASPKLGRQESIPQRDPAEVRESLIDAIDQLDLEAFRSAAKGVDFKIIKNPGVLLAKAARNGDKDIVNELLKSGIDPNIIEQGRSALHIAASQGDQEMIALLLKHDADINARDINRKTPVDLAKNNPEVLKILKAHASPKLQRQESIPQRDPAEVRRDLIEAIESDDLSKFHNTLSSLPSEYGVSFKEINLKQIDPKGEIFFKAIMMGNPKIIEAFLNDEVDPNLKNKNGVTALHYAALNGNEEVVRTLLESGADINIKDPKGRTPIDYANSQVRDILKPPRYFSLQEERKFLLNEINDEVLRMSSSSKIDVEKVDPKGEIFFKAVNAGKESLVGRFLDSGTNPNLKNKNGVTALHYAALNGNEEVVRTLLESGADINIKDPKGRTPIDLARDFKNSEVLEILQNHASHKFKRQESIPQNIVEEARTIGKIARDQQKQDPSPRPSGSKNRLLRRNSSQNMR